MDNSASMQVLEGTPDGHTRLGLAVEAVEELTERRPPGDQWILIEAARQPKVRQALTRDGRAVREAAWAIEPHLGQGDLPASVALARQLLDGQPRPRVVVISDGAAGTAEELTRDESEFVFWPVGHSDDNLGITRLSVRIHRQQSAHYAYLRVINSSADEVETQAVFEIDGNPVKVEPLAVPGNGVWEKTLQFEKPDGGVLRVWIDRPDALQADNEAFAILEPIEPATVFLVSRPDEAFFFQQVLLAMEPLVDTDRSRNLTPKEYDDREAAADLVIFNNCVPRRLPKSGVFVFVNAWPEDVPARVVGRLDQPQMTLASTEHPLTRYLHFDAARVARAWRAELVERAVVLAHSAEKNPLVFLYEEPNRRFLCVGFDVLDSDLPFRNAFPILMRNAVTYLASEPRPWVHHNYRVGEPIESLRPLPQDVSQVRVARLRADGIVEEEMPVSGGNFTFQQTEESGPLRFTIGDEFAFAAVNLTSEAESRIKPLKSSDNPREQMALTDRVAGHAPWLVLAVAATTLIGLEWLTYHFRWTE